MNELESSARAVFGELWHKYVAVVPDASRVEESLRTRGDRWREDHVAFRTLPGANTGMHILQSVFECFGYTREDDYFFGEKRLRAFWMQPPNASRKLCADVLPKIFISELVTDKFSAGFRQVVASATAQVVSSPVQRIRAIAGKAAAGDVVARKELEDACVAFLGGDTLLTRPRVSEYETLRKESECAAWTLTFGFRVNHFTVSAYLMRSFRNIHQLNHHIEKELRTPMNNSGGLTNGTPDLKLEQSSTLAAEIQVLLRDGVKNVPYAFVEFAFRHPLPNKSDDGLWDSYYQGFVTNNADKIFESTNTR